MKEQLEQASKDIGWAQGQLSIMLVRRRADKTLLAEIKRRLAQAQSILEKVEEKLNDAHNDRP